MTAVIPMRAALCDTGRDHGESRTLPCTPRAHLLGLRQVLSGRRSSLRKRHREDDAPRGAVRRRLAGVGSFFIAFAGSVPPMRPVWSWSP